MYGVTHTLFFGEKWGSYDQVVQSVSVDVHCSQRVSKPGPEVVAVDRSSVDRPLRIHELVVAVPLEASPDLRSQWRAIGEAVRAEIDSAPEVRGPGSTNHVVIRPALDEATWTFKALTMSIKSVETVPGWLPSHGLL